VGRSPFVRALLQPLGVAYGVASRLRAACYEAGVLPTRRLPGVVISVGNLTVGGTGKTPTVLWIAERLAAEGHRPAILTRGYGGFGQGSASERGSDEVALLRHRLIGQVRFGLGKDRYRNGLALAKEGAEWFILDDGFQHLKLERDANILLLDSIDPFGGGLLPAGRSRESRSALGRADIVVITRTDHAPALEAIVRRFTSAPVFCARPELEAVVRVPAMTEALPEAQLRETKCFAFCGIGNAAAFISDLKRWGVAVKGYRRFADHHRYSIQEMRELEQAGGAAGADALICTEKDVFNLPEALIGVRPVYACRIRMRFNDEEGFWRAIQASIGRRQPVTQA
jgi:tetraacyldisaccharide 4'-kinase